jgi:RNA polymerase sigma-70 factor (ECF subfamily)
MPDTDRELLDAVRAGDRGALERLLARHQAAVYRFGAKMCRDEEDAKDVLQETMIAAVRSIPEFRGTSAVSTWLYAIARSFCIKKRRTSKFAPERMESLEAQPEQAARVVDARRSPEDDAAGRQLRSALEAAISELEPMYREVLVLRDVEGPSAAEVAEITGASVEAVKSRLHRARTAVRERIAPSLAPSPPVPADCGRVTELFSQRLEGEIDANACAEMEKHLARCEDCRGRCESLRTTLSLCRSAGGPRVPAHVERSVREALHRFIAAKG